MSSPTLDDAPAPESTALFEWADRRPIGLLWLVERQFVSTSNPHGIAPDWARRLTEGVKNIELLNGQAIYIHGGFTAKLYSTQPEWQNPLPLPDVWVPRISEISKLFADAGLRWGCTLKPFFPSGMIRDVLNEKVDYQGEVSVSQLVIEEFLGLNIDWCRDQGGSVFYLDTPRGLDYSWFNKRYPDCLLMPELTGYGRTDPSQQDKLKWGFGWSKSGGHSTLRKKGLHCIYAVDHTEDIPSLAGQTDEQIRTRIRWNLNGGDILAPFCWFRSRGYRLLQEVIREAA